MCRIRTRHLTIRLWTLRIPWKGVDKLRPVRDGHELGDGEGCLPAGLRTPPAAGTQGRKVTRKEYVELSDVRCCGRSGVGTARYT